MKKFRPARWTKLDRIAMDSEIMGGQPCVRGIRIPVSLIIKLLAAGKIVEEILDDYPELERKMLNKHWNMQHGRSLILITRGIRRR